MECHVAFITKVSVFIQNLTGLMQPNNINFMNKNNPEFVVIETVQGQMTADVIKSHLESEGIPVFLYNVKV